MLVNIYGKKVYIKKKNQIKYFLYLIDMYLLKNVQIHLTVYMDSDEIKFVISNPTYINEGCNSKLLYEMLMDYMERYEINVIGDDVFNIISWIEIRVISNNRIESIINYVILNIIKIYLFILKKIYV